MNKKTVIAEIKNIILNLKKDRRTNIKGLKIMVCDYDWKRKKDANDSNFFIEWGE